MLSLGKNCGLVRIEKDNYLRAMGAAKTAMAPKQKVKNVAVRMLDDGLRNLGNLKLLSWNGESGR